MASAHELRVLLVAVTHPGQPGLISDKIDLAQLVRAGHAESAQRRTVIPRLPPIEDAVHQHASTRRWRCLGQDSFRYKRHLAPWCAHGIESDPNRVRERIVARRCAGELRPCPPAVAEKHERKADESPSKHTGRLDGHLDAICGRMGTARSIIRVGRSPAGNVKRVFSFLVATSNTTISSLPGHATKIVMPSFEGTIQYGPLPTGNFAICFGGRTVTSKA